MNRNTLAAIFIIALITLPGCRKPPIPQTMFKGKILVDATKDGGGWWYPQSAATGFSAVAPHQGTCLATYLRDIGYQVDELPRGNVITWSQLKNYTKVIRAGGPDKYSAQELIAYDSFLNRSSSLLLISEYLRDGQYDNLSEHLGLKLTGAIEGSITRFRQHPVTLGVSSINFIMGSAVAVTKETDNVTPLGWLSSNDAMVMGILYHPKSKIFFLGDINGIEQLPQPFVSNLVKWLY